MNASAADGKPVIPDQPANPVVLDEPVKPTLMDQATISELPDTLAKPVLQPKPALSEQLAKPALLPKPALPDQQEKPALPSSPTLPDQQVKPALPAKPTSLNQGVKPVLPDQQANPGLVDPQTKPVLPAPLSAAQLHQMQNAEIPLKAADISNSLNQRNSSVSAEEDVEDHRQRAATSDDALHIPSQGTSRRFLEQKRMKKLHKHQGNAATTSKQQRTFSLKSRGSSTLDQQKLVKSGRDVTNAKTGDSSNCAENTGNNLIEFERTCDFADLEEFKIEETGHSGRGKCG